MNSNPHDEMLTLRQKILDYKAALKRKDFLLLKRSELETALIGFKLEAEKDTLKSFQSQEASLQDTAKLLARKDETELLLCAATKKLYLLDHELDDLEDLNTDGLSQLQNTLLNSIISLYPDKKPLFDELQHKIKSIKDKEANASYMLKLLDHLVQLLELIQKARKTIKQQGILSYIFGANPNLMIAQSIHAIKAIIEECKTRSSEAKSIFKDDPLIPEFFSFLENLEEHCSKKWGFKHIDTNLKSCLEAGLIVQDKFKKLLDRQCVDKEALEANLEEKLLSVE